MDGPSGFDRDDITKVATRLLDEYPEATVAVMSSFAGLYCDVPASLPLNGQRISEHGRFWDLVAPKSKVAVFDAWRRVRQHGVGRAEVQLPDGGPGVLYFFDVRAAYEVVLGLLIPGEPDLDDLPELGPDAAAVSRFGRLWRDDFGRVKKIDAGAEQLLGVRPDEMLDEDPIPWIHPVHVELAYENWIETLASPGIARRWRCRHRRGDGTYLWVEITNTNLLDDPEHGLVLSEMMDISDEMEANERLRESQELLQRLAESLPSGIVQIESDGSVVYTNTRLHAILGIDRAASLSAVFAAVVLDDRSRLTAAVDRVLGTGVDVDVDVRVQRLAPTGIRVCQLTIRALRSSEGAVSGAVITVEDVTESTELRRELERRANIDALTGCANRSATIVELERMVQTPLPLNLGIGAVFIDLDHFKPINDRLGHAAGDEVLTIAAERIRTAVRGEDLVGRLGGDEFLVLCPATAGPEPLLSVARRIAARLSEPVELATGDTVPLGASIGVAWSHAGTGDTLVARADAAMYVAKQRRDGEPVLADPVQAAGAAEPV